MGVAEEMILVAKVSLLQLRPDQLMRRLRMLLLEMGESEGLIGVRYGHGGSQVLHA